MRTERGEGPMRVMLTREEVGALRVISGSKLWELLIPYEGAHIRNSSCLPAVFTRKKIDS